MGKYLHPVPDDAQFAPITTAELVNYLASCSRLAKPKVVLPIGIQASGKSTLAQALAEQAGFTWICWDKIEKETSEHWRSVPQLVFHLFSEALTRQESIIFDAMLVTPTSLDPVLQQVGKAGSDIVLVYFDISPLTCLARNRKRDNNRIPERIITDTFTNFSYSRQPYSYPYEVVTLREIKPCDEIAPVKAGDYLFHSSIIQKGTHNVSLAQQT